MAIERFEVGKRYRFIGSKPTHGWNGAGMMDFVLDGRVLLCVSAKKHSPSLANFKGFERVDSDGWFWGSLKPWFEVEGTCLGWYE